MNEYLDLLNYISQKKKVDAGTLEGLMDNIAAWESDYKGKMTPMPEAAQVGKGPGRGAFQFELSPEAAKAKGLKAGSGAANTALTRLKQFYAAENLEPPTWINELKKDFDPAALSYEQQKMLFLGDTMMAKGKDLSKLNEMSQGEWWGRFHQTQNIPEKVKAFDANAARRYYAENPPVTYEELAGMAGTGLENPLLARTDMFT